MYFAAANTAFAPQKTMVPHGALQSVRDDTSPRKIDPITKRGDIDVALHEGQPPTDFPRAARGAPDPASHIAPPSILQIEISRLLDDQVDALEAQKDKPARDRDAPSDVMADDQSRRTETEGLNVAGKLSDPDADAAPEAEAPAAPVLAQTGYSSLSTRDLSSVFKTLP